MVATKRGELFVPARLSSFFFSHKHLTPPWSAATCRRFGPKLRTSNCGPKRRQVAALQGGVRFSDRKKFPSSRASAGVLSPDTFQGSSTHGTRRVPQPLAPPPHELRRSVPAIKDHHSPRASAVKKCDASGSLRCARARTAACGDTLKRHQFPERSRRSCGRSTPLHSKSHHSSIGDITDFPSLETTNRVIFWNSRRTCK